MTINTAAFAELIWPGIADIFGQVYQDHAPLYVKMFDIKQSDKAFEKVQGVSDYGTAAVKDQGAAITYDDPMQGFQKEYVNVTYGKGATITMEMMQDELYNVFNDIPRGLARSVRKTEETVGANIYNNGFTTELAADGLSLFNAAHLNLDGTTFRNQPSVASDLTQTSLEQAVIDISNYVDDRNLPILVLGKTLIVPNELQHIAKKLLGTKFAVGSADNDISTIADTMDLVVNPYLTDTDAWFIKTDVDNGFTWMDRMAADIDRDNEFDTKNLRFSAVRRFSAGMTDPRGGYGSAGA